jgi:hypothetical protein
MVASHATCVAQQLPSIMRGRLTPFPYGDGVESRFCDDLGPDGFGWVVEEPATRTSHVLAAEGRIWFVDALDRPDAIERALGLGEPAGVIQLLDRHNRDCAALAARFGVPHVVAPRAVPGSPFTFVDLVNRRFWRESVLWWPETRTLVVAEALATNRFYTGGTAPIGVHPVLRLTPPKALAAFEPERVLVGHGEGVLGGASSALHDALRWSRRGLPGVLLRLPLALRAPSRPR